MNINLDKIAGRRVAIHIPEVADAIAFAEAVGKRFPEKTENLSNNYITWHSEYENDDGFCFFPRFTESRGMSYGRRSTYDEWGVPVVEFEELIISAEELNTLPSDYTIEFLFGT